MLDLTNIPETCAHLIQSLKQIENSDELFGFEKEDLSKALRERYFRFKETCPDIEIDINLRDWFRCDYGFGRHNKNENDGSIAYTLQYNLRCGILNMDEKTYNLLKLMHSGCFKDCRDHAQTFDETHVLMYEKTFTFAR